MYKNFVMMKTIGEVNVKVDKIEKKDTVGAG